MHVYHAELIGLYLITYAAQCYFAEENSFRGRKKIESILEKKLNSPILFTTKHFFCETKTESWPSCLHAVKILVKMGRVLDEFRSV